MSNQDELWVSWDEYHLLIEQLGAQIWHSGWVPDRIVCIARGGLRVGDVLSRLFQCPLDIIFASSYSAEAGKVQGDLKIANTNLGLNGPLQGNTLLVDDLADSGLTLQSIEKMLGIRNPAIKELRTAVLWQKAKSVVSPDYVAIKMNANPWIHQPFETYDQLNHNQLVDFFERKRAK